MTMPSSPALQFMYLDLTKEKKKFFAKSTNMVAMLSYARGHFGFPLLFTQIIKGHVLTRNNETKPAPKQNNQND